MAGFKFDLYNRNLELEKTHKFPLAVKTGTTIVGLIFKVLEN